MVICFFGKKLTCHSVWLIFLQFWNPTCPTDDVKENLPYEFICQHKVINKVFIRRTILGFCIIEQVHICKLNSEIQGGGVHEGDKNYLS